MSDTIWVDVKGRGAGDLPQDNSILLRLRDELDRLSGKLRIQPLSEFYDYSELRAQYADFLEQPAPTDRDGEVLDEIQAGEVWFDPAAALIVVGTIHDHLEQHPENFDFSSDPKRRHWRASLMAELQHCRSTLQAAVSQGRQFRFLIVP